MRSRLSSLGKQLINAERNRRQHSNRHTNHQPLFHLGNILGAIVFVGSRIDTSFEQHLDNKHPVVLSRTLDGLIPLHLMPNQDKHRFVMLYAHGGLSSNYKFSMRLFKSELGRKGDVLKHIPLLQEKTDATNFCILACYSGALINDISSLNPAQLEDLGLRSGTRIISFGSSNHRITTNKASRIITQITNEEGHNDTDEFLAKLSLEYGITISSFLIEKDKETTAVRKKYNLHKYPEVWKKILKEGEKASLTLDEKIELKFLEIIQPKKYGQISNELSSRFKYLKNLQSLFDTYGSLCKKDPEHMTKMLENFPNEALMESSLRGNYQRVVGWYKTGKIDINYRDKNNQTPLLNATISNNRDMVTFLLEKGADIKAIDNDGDSVLIKAALLQDPKMAKLLLEKGADIDAINNQGFNALMAAILFNNSETAIELLKNGANPSLIIKEKTISETSSNNDIKNLLLPIKILQEKFDSIQTLKEKISVRACEIKDKDGLCPMLVAKNEGEDVVKILKAALEEIDNSSENFLLIEQIIKNVIVDKNVSRIKLKCDFKEIIKPSLTVSKTISQALAIEPKHYPTIIN